jgi:hypothetical protein
MISTKAIFFVNIDNEKVKRFLCDLCLITIWLFLDRSVCLPTEKLKIKVQQQVNNMIMGWRNKPLILRFESRSQFSKLLECTLHFCCKYELNSQKFYQGF